MKIYGLYWYYCLIPKEKTKGLFTDYPRSSLMNKFLICWDYQDKEKNRRLYHLFDSYLDFVIFYFKIPENERCFYEIVLGEFPQKIHFDIDIEIETNEDDKKILNELIKTVIELVPEIKPKKDICIYNSHGEKKKSYHLIINHFCHKNNDDAKSFYYTVMSKLPKEYFEKQWIDSAVYSKTQQFRTLGSMKPGTNRIKIFQEKWIFDNLIEHIYDEEPEDEKTKFLIQFEESIVGARYSNCKLLPSFEKPSEFEKKTQTNYENGEDIEHDLAVEAINLLAHSMNLEVIDPKFPFKFDKIEGPFVILKRVKPSKCRICKRIHEHQNPYLFITTKEKYVFYHCRRAAANKKMFLGSLEIEGEEPPFQKLEIVEGNFEERKEEKKEEIPNDWTKKTLERLKGIASSQLETKKSKKIEKDFEPKHREKIINYCSNN
jgi:hypothetical protein